MLACLAPGALHARPPQSREWRGTVTAVDAARQQITITDAQHRRLALRWTERTRFVAGVEFTTVDAVRRGAAVEVRYRSPLFGGPFVTKVALLSQTKNKTNPRNKT